MKIRFYGPLGRVAGSCAMLYDETLKFRALIDCGMQQGEGNERWNTDKFPFDPASIDLVLLTHAHIDHSGLLPKLVREGFSGQVICTPETADVARLLLRDSARLSDIYSCADVDRVRFRPVDKPFGSSFKLKQDVVASFYRTSHILGAVSIRVSWGQDRLSARSIVFSGDLGVNEPGKEQFPILGSRMRPVKSTFAVVESTYGDTARSTAASMSSAGRVEELRRLIIAGVERGGTILIPAFALDRTAALLVDLSRLWASEPRLTSVPIFVHHGLASDCAGLYSRHLRAKDTERGAVLPRWISDSMFRELGLTRRSDERDLEDALAAILDPEGKSVSPLPQLPVVHRWIRERVSLGGPHVVIASSGMCEGGAILGYLPHVLRDEKSTFLTSGFASGGSVAGKIREVGFLSSAARHRLTDSIQLNDGSKTIIERSTIRATIEALDGYSAHADQRGLLRWLLGTASKSSPIAGTVFIQHGDDLKRRKLRDAVRRPDASLQVILPSQEAAEYDLDAPKAGGVSEETRLSAIETRLAALERRMAE